MTEDDDKHARMDAFTNKMMVLFGIMVVLSLLVGLGGCAPGSTAVQPVNIVGSDFCKIADKITWDPKDTKQTIKEVRRHNAKYDRRCMRSSPTS